MPSDRASMGARAMVVPPPEPKRVRLPDERRSITHHFEIVGAVTIGGESIPVRTDGHVTIGLYDDGRPGEIFIDRLTIEPIGSSDQIDPVRDWLSGVGLGATALRLLDAWCVMVSIHLQCGAAIEDVAAKFRGWNFEPRGMTNTAEIRQCSSPIDYIAQWLILRFCQAGDQGYE